MATLGSFNGISGYAGIYDSLNFVDEPEYYRSTMVFQQSSAPTGWTKQILADDFSLRVVNTSGSKNQTGFPFSTIYSAPTSPLNLNPANPIYPSAVATISATLGTTTIATNQMENHTHTQGATVNAVSAVTLGGSPSVNNNRSITAYPNVYGSFVGTTSSGGSGGGHSHTLSANIVLSPNFGGGFDIKYVDAILATRN
jgi:hypothetical protein